MILKEPTFRRCSCQAVVPLTLTRSCKIRRWNKSIRLALFILVDERKRSLSHCILSCGNFVSCSRFFVSLKIKHLLCKIFWRHFQYVRAVAFPSCLLTDLTAFPFVLILHLVLSHCLSLLPQPVPGPSLPACPQMCPLPLNGLCCFVPAETWLSSSGLIKVPGCRNVPKG